MTGLIASTPEFDIAAFGIGGDNAEAAVLANGNYVVTWSQSVALPVSFTTDASSTAIAARILNADGTPAGDAFQVNTTEPFIQGDAELTALSGGGFVIAWTDQTFSADQTEARAQVFNASGVRVGTEITLATSSLQDQRMPHLAALPDGGFVAFWQDSRSTGTFDDDLYGQNFGADGSRNGPEFVAWNSGADVSRLEVIALSNGHLRFLADGDFVTSDGTTFVQSGSGNTVLNASSRNTQETGFEQNFYSDMTLLENDRYAYAGVTASAGHNEPNGIGVWVRDSANYDNLVQLDPFGSFRPEIASDTGFTSAAQNFVGIDITGTADGGFVVVWGLFTETNGTGDFNIYAQAFDADLNKLGANTLVHTDVADNQSAPFVVQGGDGNILIGWTDNRAATDGVLATTGRLFSIDSAVGNGPINGTPNADTLDGTIGNDTINGLGDNDILNGLAGDDILNGGDGTDTLIGGAGNDILTGGTSTADLRDLILGGDGDDIIDGGYGNDELRGDAGNDTMAGGFGADTVIGGTGDDVMTGSALSDLLYGGDGMDFVNGGYGHDRVNGGDGADRFFHVGVHGHGSDWIQDYDASEGDTLLFGIGSADGDDFLVNYAHTASAAGERSGDDAVAEAFVIYIPTGQIMWALVDGAGQDQINIVVGGTTYDLIG